MIKIGSRVRINEAIRSTNGVEGTIIAIEPLLYPDHTTQICIVQYDQAIPVGMGIVAISAAYPEDELIEIAEAMT